MSIISEDSSPIIAYKFRPSEPGVFVELYLPKKSTYQGILYNTLTTGFKLDEVKKYFLEATGSKKEAIDKMLRPHAKTRHLSSDKKDDSKPLCLADYKPDFINNFMVVFRGYSMYEVDGVFCEYYKDENNEDTTEVKKPFEERTQVIRIIFRPDYKAIKNNPDFHSIDEERITELSQQYFRSGKVEIKDFLDKNSKLSESETKLVHHLDKWIDYVVLFLFGYLIVEITREIVNIDNEARQQAEQRGETPMSLLEQEIWVTSLWNLSINRISYK